MTFFRTSLLIFATAAALPAAAQELTLYSGRGETLVAPVIEAFTAETGIEVNVRYAGTAELAILLQEEGDISPADLYWAQDVAALGAVKALFAELPAETLNQVDPLYRDADGRWIGISGRARVLIYAPDRVAVTDLPATLAELVDPRFDGRIALPPTNGSFVAHVAALRVAYGDAGAQDWLNALAANNPVIVSNNTAAYQAIADGEADIAITNNYYLGRFLASDPAFPVAQTSFAAGDIGNLMMPAGIGILASSVHSEEAVAFINYLLSNSAQEYFTGAVFEYTVTGHSAASVEAFGVSFADAVAAAPAFDVNLLTDLEGAIALIREAGLL
jgi:iron(III) transport system substrate-binding protein